MITTIPKYHFKIEAEFVVMGFIPLNIPYIKPWYRITDIIHYLKLDAWCFHCILLFASRDRDHRFDPIKVNKNTVKLDSVGDKKRCTNGCCVWFEMFLTKHGNKVNSKKTTKNVCLFYNANCYAWYSM